MSLVKASIDFGTTYSGWAFSFRHEFERDALQISAKQWFGGSLVSLKVVSDLPHANIGPIIGSPTCVLIKPDRKTLDSFGYEAETRYAALATDKVHKEWYFFKRFKMVLFGRLGVEKNLTMKDVLGKPLPAKTVFALAIRWLKDDLLNKSQERFIGEKLLPTDVGWVLTVPAIWNDAAKQFMREAAVEAGINNSQLIICLEPEAASLYCRSLSLTKTCKDGPVPMKTFAHGTKYLVLDAGGGTVDITVHEVINDDEVRELLGASGGAWGGTKVDEAFERFLDEIAGASQRSEAAANFQRKEILNKECRSYPIMEAFKTEDMEEYIEFGRDFEIKKRAVVPGKREKENIKLPVVLMDLVKEKTNTSMEDHIKSSRYADQIKFMKDKIRIDSDVMKSLFDQPVNSILSHLTSLLAVHAVDGCKTFVLVGGFSESPVLQQAVKNKFSSINVIIPADAGLAVLKGAVIFGHKPSAIAERVMRHTYGTNTFPSIFSVHAKLGQSVKIGEELGGKTYCPHCPSQTIVTFSIYTSPEKNPSLITDPGCVKIGSITVPIPDTSLGKDREFEVSFLFGGTELKVKVIDKAADKTFYTIINCLDNSQTKD